MSVVAEILDATPVRQTRPISDAIIGIGGLVDGRSTDEDFSDQRTFPISSHAGIIRLRVWPTTIEETQDALARLLAEVPDAELAQALVIIDRHAIRVRRGS
ncbi:MAG: hypothetical protein IPP12_17570 [Nitrospira sp.]|nr:hypothetical protein [Nitrospira sp.]